MNDYGEHLWLGQLGHFFILLSLFASIAATVSYFFSVRKSALPSGADWKRLARISFITESFSVFAIFALIYYINSHHYFEYKYAWQHSSLSLEPKYLLSGIWEGQEGSFLLWTIWHSVLGLIIISREKEWEGPVMTVLGFAQICLATMVIGLHIGDVKIGSNPFILLRNSGVLDKAPAFYTLDGSLRQDYLSLIKDGNDLNPLLQNYWMVIHPPVLFLGFASTIIPFAFAIGGLWTRKFGEWTRAVWPWALFSGAVLGLGIMMGARWAYESLNFGGYWAWDPVENASLVPWLILVAGLHALLIFRHTGNALRTTFLFLILSFLFVLYSTYLTRSGVLQDTSVHAFTLDKDGEDWFLILQFLLLPVVFAVPALVLFGSRYKSIPHVAKEEETSSREFWMFIGSLVLFLSALTIIGMTSIPVFNKIAALFSSNDKLFKPLAIGEDSEYAYNRIQIFVAIILALFTGFGMYLKYKATGRPFLKKLIIPSLTGLVIAALILSFGGINYREKGLGYLFFVWLAVAASVYAAITNGAYIFSGFKGRLLRSGGAFSHVGFALMLLGILLSSAKKEVLSLNRGGIPVFFNAESKEKPGENLTLVKGLKTDMGAYWVTYDKDSTHPQKPMWFYHLSFQSKDGKENFGLWPNAFVNYKGNEGLMANPDAKHHITYDIFTYISSTDNRGQEDTTSFRPHNLRIGDTVFYSKGFAVLKNLEAVKEIPGIQFTANDSASVATLQVFSKTSSIYTIKPILINKGGESFSQPDSLLPEGLVVQLQKAAGKSAELGLKESQAIMQYVTLKAYKFPYIQVLWLGTVVMVIGFLISMYNRRERRKAAAAKL